jgi:peptidoglycan hydrolase-like protein with peptidoglycan-binding domain
MFPKKIASIAIVSSLIVGTFMLFNESTSAAKQNISLSKSIVQKFKPNKLTNVYLKINSTGEDVKTIQFVLKQLGYNTGTIDGIYGPKTLNSIKSFQKYYKLTVDGTVGNNTWNKIMSFYNKWSKG